MKRTLAFAIQALILTLLFNTALAAAVFYLMGGDFATYLSIDFTGEGMLQNREVVILAVTLGVSLVLWLLLYLVGAGHIRRAAREPASAARPAEERKEKRAAMPDRPPTTSAVQMLALLQRQGRFIDFLQEDLQQYGDAQIGAAVRSVHEGCRQALTDHVALEPIFEAPEGSEVTVEPGFDTHAIRLTGNVMGEPPFKGALRHRGWRVRRVDLPALMPGQEEKVLAAAEVEVNV